MRKIYILLVIVLLIASPALSAEEKAERKADVSGIWFQVYYASVQNVLKHGNGCFEQLSRQPHAILLSNFWWGYIMKECNEYFDSQIERISKYTSGETVQEGVEKMRQQCAMAVIFDNWDRINATISKNPQKECKPTPKLDGRKQK